MSKTGKVSNAELERMAINDEPGTVVGELMSVGELFAMIGRIQEEREELEEFYEEPFVPPLEEEEANEA